MMTGAWESVEERVAALAQVPFFADLSKRQLRRLGELSIPRAYPPGKRIVEEGSTGLGLYLIVDGEVEVFKGEGRSRLVLDTLGDGSVVGELALIDDLPRSASAVALRATRCLLVTRDAFQTLSEKDPEIAWCLVPVLADRLRKVEERLQDERSPTVTRTLQIAVTGKDRGPGIRSGKFSVPAGGHKTLPARDGRPEAERESSLGLDLLRGQMALLVAGGTAVSALADVGKGLVSELAREVEPARARDAAEVLERLPAGLANALRASVVEAAKVPARVGNAFRRNWRTGERSYGSSLTPEDGKARPAEKED